jgi:O-antigen/teichoic acid export membrane protein
VSAPIPAEVASRAAARSVSAIAVNQVSQITGSLLFVALVPRILGPVVYGQLAFTFALIAILQMCGELGYQEIFSRFLPEVRRRDGRSGVRAMARGLFLVRGLIGLGLGVLSLVVARLAVGWFTNIQLVLIAVAVAARVWSMGPFPLLLGLGETYKWSVETTWRQLVVTALVLALVRTPSLTLGLLATTLHEVLFLVLGLWWVKGWVFGKPETGGGTVGHREAGGSQPEETPDAKPLPSARARLPVMQWLRFGFIFSMANLALVMLFRISPISVELLTGRHSETGYFDLALGSLLLLYTMLGQVAYAFVPILTQLHLEHQVAEAEAWLGRVVRYESMLVGLATGFLWAVAGPMAPLLFGESFAPAAGTMRMIGFSLLALPVAWAGVTMAAVERQPRRKLWAALLGLAVFALAAPLLRWAGADGIAVAFSLAMAGYAAGFGRGARQALRAGGMRYALSLAATGLFVPLLLLKIDWLPLALTAWATLATIYVAIMLVTGVAHGDDGRLFLSGLKR